VTPRETAKLSLEGIDLNASDLSPRNAHSNLWYEKKRKNKNRLKWSSIKKKYEDFMDNSKDFV